MSRKIKFRAWDNRRKIMYPNVQNTYDFMVSEGGCMEENFKCVLGDDNYKVMQYTGEKDINNVEIYEGDIVETTRALNHIIGVVRYHKASWCIQSEEGYRIRLISIFSTAENKVIGNIYENPELLEKK